jgi:hypothetical protein
MALKIHDQFVRFYQFLLNRSIVARWTLFITPVLAIIWIPGIVGLTASHRGEVRFLFHSGSVVMWIILISIFADMGSAFDMVEYMAERRMGRCDHDVLFHTVLVSCRSNFAGWWACLAGAYVSFRTLRPSRQFLSAIFAH